MPLEVNEELCAELSARIPEIMVEWQTLTNEEPWFSLPEDRRLDSIPVVLELLVRVALCDPKTRAELREQLHAAARHGEDRRSSGFAQELVFTEYYLLREAIWRYLQASARTHQDAAQAILHIDTALSLTTRASLQGYHRGELEAMGRWPEAIEALVREAPLAA